MMVGKKISRETLLLSVREDDGDEGHVEELLGAVGSRSPSRPRHIYSRGSVDNQTVARANAWGLSAGNRVGNEADDGDEDEEEAGRSDQPLDGQQRDNACFTLDEDSDTDLELEDERDQYDLTGQVRYREACKRLGVIPASCFLRTMQKSEVSMAHHGLGPQGAVALAVPLVTNTSIVKLNLRDNWMEGVGGAAMADMLKENCYITELDLSENRIGELGAKALASMLLENTTLASLNLSQNCLDKHATRHLATALSSNQHLQHLDMSHNRLGEAAGEILGAALAENTGMKSFNLAWNCIRGKGVIALAKGLGANIFLRVVDLSYNGLGKEGAVAVGQGLKDNNTLEELNISVNRIPPEGAIHLAVGLRVNKTIRILKMARNPVQSVGCFAVLKAIQGNPASAVEYLDFSDISVDQEFEDMFCSIKESLPDLQVKHGGERRTLQKTKS
ncbi:hypothetical protein P4O66_012214 [Electrophorus voltai]|uniref:Leucine rich repeat containing 74B n=1 Tax=Electrophorus voltai TaxID=2609070 RepID=A0AAD9DT59_9TELE|nr:hypothetical protein P4O66_012214 [Electrophorus voltai]